MGGDGVRAAADISVLANNYMETRLLAVPGVGETRCALTARWRPG